MKITKSQLKQIIQEESISMLREIEDSPKFQRGGGLATGLKGVARMARELSPINGPHKEMTPARPVYATQTLDPKEEIMIWYNGDWHKTVLTDEEHEAIHSAFDPDYERLTDVVERVLSSMRELDIEDVEL